MTWKGVVWEELDNILESIESYYGNGTSRLGSRNGITVKCILETGTGISETPTYRIVLIFQCCT